MTRELVTAILVDVTKNGEYSHVVLRNTLNKYQYLEKKDRAFITRVVEGTLERMIEIDYIIEQFSTVKVKKMKPVIRSILRSAVYEIKYMENVPHSASCNEAVKLAQKLGFHNLKGFVNGVLRNIARNLETITYPDDMSIRYSMPQWMIDKWLGEYDKETVEKMLQSFLKERVLTIRCNLNQLSVEELVEQLQKEGVQVENHAYLPYALQISGYDYLAELESFQKGAFYVQDVSSMMVAHVADPKEGTYVLDVCSAPGGKALHAAEKLQGTGHVEARDLTDYKVGMLWENIERSGLKNIEAVRWDATILDEKCVGKADVVLADVPCSGLGVLGKKADLKYRLTETSLQELVALQREILETVKQYVKPGGTLVYSTCTICKEENMGNVEWFLQENPEFQLAPIQGYLCDELKQSVKTEGCLQFLPGIHESDGFFIAKFKRTNNG